jgi:hypothetical protein
MLGYGYEKRTHGSCRIFSDVIEKGIYRTAVENQALITIVNRSANSSASKRKRPAKC